MENDRQTAKIVVGRLDSPLESQGHTHVEKSISLKLQEGDKFEGIETVNDSELGHELPKMSKGVSDAGFLRKPLDDDQASDSLAALKRKRMKKQFKSDLNPHGTNPGTAEPTPVMSRQGSVLESKPASSRPPPDSFNACQISSVKDQFKLCQHLKLNKKEREKSKKPIKTWTTLMQDDKFRNLLNGVLPPQSQQTKSPTLIGGGERKLGDQDRDAFRAGGTSEESGEDVTESKWEEPFVHMKRSYMDPTNGLLQVQGNAFIHLALSVTLLFVKKEDSEVLEANDPAGCKEKIEDFDFVVDLMFVVHIMCFVLLNLEYVGQTMRSKVAYFFKAISFITVPLYQGSIIYLLEIKTKDNSACYDQLGQLIWWTQLEIICFNIYMGLTITAIFKSRFTSLGIMQRKFLTQGIVAHFLEEVAERVLEKYKKVNNFDIDPAEFDFAEIQENQSFNLKDAHDEDVQIFVAKAHNKKKELKSLRFLDLDKEEDRKIHAWQRKNDFGDTLLNFHGISPFFWLQEWTGVGIKDFQDKRNLLLNKEDFFSNDPLRIGGTSVLEFQLISSVFYLLFHEYYYEQFANREVKATEDETAIFVIMILLILHHLGFYVCAMFHYRWQDDHSLCISSRAFKCRLDEYNKQSYELFLDNHSTTRQSKEESSNFYAKSHVPQRGTEYEDYVSSQVIRQRDCKKRTLYSVATILWLLSLAAPFTAFIIDYDLKSDSQVFLRFWIIIDSILTFVSLPMAYFIFSLRYKSKNKLYMYAIQQLQRDLKKEADIIRRVEEKHLEERAASLARDMEEQQKLGTLVKQLTYNEPGVMRHSESLQDLKNAFTKIMGLRFQKTLDQAVVLARKDKIAKANRELEKDSSFQSEENYSGGNNSQDSDHALSDGQGTAKPLQSEAVREHNRIESEFASLATVNMQVTDEHNKGTEEQQQTERNRIDYCMNPEPSKETRLRKLATIDAPEVNQEECKIEFENSVDKLMPSYSPRAKTQAKATPLAYITESEDVGASPPPEFDDFLEIRDMENRNFIDDLQDKLDYAEDDEMSKMKEEHNRQFREYIELDKDIYCYTICANIATDQFSPNQLESLMRKCVMVFCLQILLTTFFYYYMKEDGVEHIQRPRFSEQCVRLMCAFIMHLFIHPELRQALSIMRFLKFTRRKQYFNGRFKNFLIALMKLFSGLYCEVILILMISEVDSVADIIKDFVALGFIVEIDNYFANNMDDKSVEELVDRFNEECEIEKYHGHRQMLFKLIKRKVKAIFTKNPLPGQDLRDFGHKAAAAHPSMNLELSKQESSEPQISRSRSVVVVETEQSEMHDTPELWSWWDIFTDCLISGVYFVLNELYVILYYYVFFLTVVILNQYFYDEQPEG